MNSTACRAMAQPILLTGIMALSGCSGGASSNRGDSGGAPGSEPPGDPAAGEATATVTLTATDAVVAPGDTVVLSWSSKNVTSCRASGGWDGSRAIQGSATVGPLSEATSYSLTCSGSAGNSVAMLSVGVYGLVTLEWQSPRFNVDGTPLEDLAGFRIYYGEFSGSYTDVVAVDDSATERYQIELPSGRYYFAMTALDAAGNESAYSNEVIQVVH